MALQVSYEIPKTGTTATEAYIKILQSNIKFAEETTGRVDFAIYANKQARTDWKDPFETVIYEVVDKIVVGPEEEDQDFSALIDASVWLDEATLSEEGVTIRKQLYAFLKTQDVFASAIDV